MSANPVADVEPGDTISYTVGITTTTSAQHYTFAVTLPQGVTFVDAIPAGADVGNTCVVSGNTVNCSVAPGVYQNPGFTTPWIINVTVNAIAPGTCPAPLVVSAIGNWEDAVAATASTSYGCPNLSLGISADKTEAQGGDIITYTITVTNNGGATEDKYLFYNALPADTRLADGNYTMPGGGAHCHGNTTGSFNFDCEGYNLGPGETHTYVFRAKVSTSVSPTMCQGLTSWLRGVGYPDYGMWDEASRDIRHTITMLCPALSVTKTDDVDTGVALLTPYTYTITVTNTGTSAMGEFTVIDYLPEGVQPTGPLDARCTTGMAGARITVTCGDTGVPIGESNTLSFDITVMAVPAPGNTTCASVENMVSGDRGIWVPGQQTAFATTLVNCASSLTFTKQPLVSPVVPGGTIGYEITLTNTGGAALTTATISDTLPTLPDGATWTYTVNGSPVAGSPFDAPFTNIASGQSVVIRAESSIIPADVQVPGNAWCTDFTNSASVTATSSTGVSLSESASATVQVNCSGLLIEKSVNAGVIPLGGTVTYTITATNLGNTVLGPIFLVDELEDTGGVFTNFTVASDDAFDCEIVEGNLACIYESLAPGQSVEMIVTGTAPAIPTWEQCGPVENTAWGFFIVGTRPELVQVRSIPVTPPLTQIFSNTVTTQLDCQPGIDIEKSGTVNTGADGRVDAGDTITYTFDVTNSGNIPLYDIAVTDNLAGLMWDSAPEMAELAPGATATFTATYAVSQTDIDVGFVDNIAVVSASTAPEASEEPGFMQVQAEESLTLTAEDSAHVLLPQQPGIELVKVSVANPGDNDVLNAGETVLYTVTVTNTGNVTLTTIVVTDHMDGLTLEGDTTRLSLAPGETMNLAATYTVTQADVDAGMVENCADVSAAAPGQQTVADDDCVTDLVDQNPSLLVIQACPAPESSFMPKAGDEVTFQITIRNDGDQTVNDVSVVVSREGTLDSPFPATLAPGQSETRAFTTGVSEADYAGRGMTVDVTATGDTGAGEQTLQAETSVENTVSITCEMGEVPVVTKLPNTGAGNVASVAGMLWAAMIGMAALGIGAAGVRISSVRR